MQEKKNIAVISTTAANMLIGRAVSIGSLWLTVKTFSEITTNADCETPAEWAQRKVPMIPMDSLWRFGKVTEHFDLIQSLPDSNLEKIEFESEKMALMCLDAWRVVPMEEAWEAVQSIISEQRDKAAKNGVF